MYHKCARRLRLYYCLYAPHTRMHCYNIVLLPVRVGGGLLKYNILISLAQDDSDVYGRGRRKSVWAGLYNTRFFFPVKIGFEICRGRLPPCPNTMKARGGVMAAVSVKVGGSVCVCVYTYIYIISHHTEVKKTTYTHTPIG